MIMKIKYLLLFSLLMFEYSLAAVPNDWQKRFLSPSVADRPWAVWSWDNKDVTFQEVRDKLDTMHKVGFGGCCILAVNAYREPGYWRVFNFTMKEADRLGMDLGMQMSDHGSLPDDIRITPSEAMQRLVWSDTIVDGGTLRNLALPQPILIKDIMKIYRLMHFLPVLIMPVSYRFPGIPLHKQHTSSARSNPCSYLCIRGALLRGCLKGNGVYCVWGIQQLHLPIVLPDRNKD